MEWVGVSDGGPEWSCVGWVRDGKGSGGEKWIGPPHTPLRRM